MAEIMNWKDVVPDGFFQDKPKMAEFGMPTIIFLAFLLATGILLVILSCALDNNWLSLLVLVIYLIGISTKASNPTLAPLPNIITKRLSGSDEYYEEDHSKGLVETGHFITAVLITSGFGLPLVLNHGMIISDHSMILSLVGGLLIYLTILGYIRFFSIHE